MRLLTLGFFAVVILSLLKVQPATAQSETRPLSTAQQATSPEVIAIKFHADWCGSCRRMGSVFEDLATVAEDQPVLFTQLDLTDRSSRKQAEYLMSLLKLGQIWEEAGAGEKTGFILLVDADNHEVLGQLTADQDLKQMKAALADTVTKAQG